jgi:hypothetical protein
VHWLPVLAGLVLVVHAWWPPLSNLGLLALAAVLVSIYSLVYVFLLGLLFLGSQGDYGHCQEMIQTVVVTAPIPASAFRPTEPAIFCREGNYGLFGTRHQILEVYGTADRAKQDAILAKLDQAKPSENTEAIQVLFYEKENVLFWKKDRGGANGGTRGPESLIRIAVVH